MASYYNILNQFFRIQDPVLFWPRLGSGMRKNPYLVSGRSGINILVHISKSFVSIFGLKIHWFFVVEPNPGSGAFLTPGFKIWDGKSPDLGSGIRSKHPGSYFRELSINSLGKKYFNSVLRNRIWDLVLFQFFDPGNRDPGWKKSRSGIWYPVYL